MNFDGCFVQVTDLEPEGLYVRLRTDGLQYLVAEVELTECGLPSGRVRIRLLTGTRTRGNSVKFTGENRARSR